MNVPREIRPEQDDLELYAAMEVADCIRTARKAFEKESNFKQGSTLHTTLLAAEDKAMTRAWIKIIKKFPGVCRYLYGDRTKKLKKDIERFEKAAKKLNERTKKGRKLAVNTLVTVILTLAGITGLPGLAIPWVLDKYWAIAKWQFRQYKRLFSWLSKNIDEIGDFETLREECKKTKPRLPSKIERAVKENKK